MSRIIIDVDDSVDVVRALRCVATVVDQGRISEAGGIEHYCWHTTFVDRTNVSCRRKKRAEAADSFNVYRTYPKDET